MSTVDLAGFVRALRASRSNLEHAERHGLDKGAELIEHEAKALIGTEYPGWAALAERTLAEKSAKGQLGRISAEDTLYAKGDLRESIGRSVQHPVALVGTHDPVALYHELGTSRMPPRPIFGAAGFRKGKEAAKAVGEAVAVTIAGRAMD